QCLCCLTCSRDQLERFQRCGQNTSLRKAIAHAFDGSLLRRSGVVFLKPCPRGRSAPYRDFRIEWREAVFPFTARETLQLDITLFENFDHLRIELRTSPALHELHCFVERHCLAIWPVRSQGVEAIDDGKNSRTQRN